MTTNHRRIDHCVHNMIGLFVTLVIVMYVCGKTAINDTGNMFIVIALMMFVCNTDTTYDETYNFGAGSIAEGAQFVWYNLVEICLVAAWGWMCVCWVYTSLNRFVINIMFSSIEPLPDMDPGMNQLMKTARLALILGMCCNSIAAAKPTSAHIRPILRLMMMLFAEYFLTT